MRRVSRCALYAFTLKTLAGTLLATLCYMQVAAQQGQTAARPDRGVNPGGAYAVSDIENISLQNGNLNLSIPLASLPPVAGGKLSLTIRATYNSKLWNITRQEKEAGFPAQRYVVDTPQLSDEGGWRVEGRYFIVFREAREDFDYLPPTVGSDTDLPEFHRLTEHTWYKVILRTPDGAEHELRPSGNNFLTYGGIDYPRTYLWGFHTAVPTAATGPVRYETTDGTYISAVYNPAGDASGIRWTLFLPDGTQIIDYDNGIQRIRDTNSNAIKIYADIYATHYQDEQTGREVAVEDIVSGPKGYPQTRVWYQTVNGVWQHVDVNFGVTVVKGKTYKVSDWQADYYGEAGGPGRVCQRHQQLPPQEMLVVREIVFPATEPNKPGRRFSFSYNSDQTELATTAQFYEVCGQAPGSYTRDASRGMGALNHMETPSGAKVDYAYTLASTHDFVGLVGPDRLTRETIADKYLTHGNEPEPEHWHYDIPYDSIGTTSTVTNPDGSTSTVVFYQRHPDYPRGLGTNDLLAGQVYVTTDGLTLTHKRWAMRGTTWATGTDNFTVSNPYVEAEYTSLVEGGLTVKMSAKTYEYDYNGNVTKVTEYDWFDPASAQRDPYGIPTGVPAGAKVLRVTDTSYHSQAADADSPGYYGRRALTPGTPSILNAVKETSVGASRTRFSYDGQAYGVAPTAGNVTKVSRRDDKGDTNDQNDTEIETSTTYGDYGNPSTATDPNGNVTRYFYGDDTHALPTKVEVDPLNGTGVQATLTTYDFATGLVTSVTDPNGQVSTVAYTNLLLGTVDPLKRPGVTRAPAGTTADGTTLYRKVLTFYEDEARRVRTESDLNVEGDDLLKSRTTCDELGRVVLTEQNEGSSSFDISARTVYAENGRVTLQSAPTRAGASAENWTRVTKDMFGRMVEAATFGGPAQPSATAAADAIPNWTGSVTTSYWADETTVTDQAGRKRRSVSDALGRLVRIDEPDKSTGALNDSGGNPVQPTFYAYDALGNLRKVDQGGQLRFFLYDSLGRLIRAKNPEQGSMAADDDLPSLTDQDFGNPSGQWSVGYLYDKAGNLAKRKDARGVITSYLYDGLNRNTAVTYKAAGGAASTPNVTRTYDGAPRGKGRLWKSEAAGTGLTTVEEYDAAGRPLRQSQKFRVANEWGAAYDVGYGYNLAGNVKTEAYPSGHSVAYAYDGAGRLNSFSGNLGGEARTYADSFAYDASGRRSQERYSTQTPVFNKHLFNSRGQLAEIRVSTYGLTAPGNESNWNRGAIINHYSSSGWGASGGGPDNNGNLRRQDVFIPKLDGSGYDHAGGYDLFTQSYDYDALNRLTRAQEMAEGQIRWAQVYDYDRWGNRTVNAAETWLGGAPAPQSDKINEAQFDRADLANTNRLYAPGDAAIQDMAQRRMRYDAAGNLTHDEYTGAGDRTYDAENRMTSAQFVSGQAQVAGYVYDADGRRIKRAVNTGDETWQVYGAGGELLAEYAPNASPTQPRKEYGYRGGELLVTAAPGQPRVNVALASSGATATASTTYSAAFPAAGANDGDHVGANWGAGGGWNDATAGAYPDWLQVSFSGPKTIDEINVYTLQDALGNSSEPTELMTFTRYGVVDFDVQYWTGSEWATVPGGSVTGNNKVWRKFTFPAVTANSVRVVVGGALNTFSRVVEVEAYEAQRANYAASANGGVATASSTYSTGFPAASVNNGERKGAGWGSGQGGWNDATGDGYPDWVELAFTGPKRIDEVEVFTLQDNVGSPSEPAESMSFTQYGITSFEVQYWTGSAWATVTGGNITGNNRVWRKVSFPAVTTARVRVLVSGALASYSRIVEIEAWGGAGGAAGADLRWLVTDQLGTPRMVLDRTGNLTAPGGGSGMSRHDYLPFGEGLSAGAGRRVTAQGYDAGDHVRQKFAGSELDSETELHFMQARYFSSRQGRFTGVDALLASCKPILPQSFNRYTYALNNPLRLIDPSGLDPQDPQPQLPDCDGTSRASCYPTDDSSEIFGYYEITEAASRVVGGIGTARQVTNQYVWGAIGADVSDFVANGLNTAAREGNKIIYGEKAGTTYNKVVEHPVTQLALIAAGGIEGFGRGAPASGANTAVEATTAAAESGTATDTLLLGRMSRITAAEAEGRGYIATTESTNPRTIWYYSYSRIRAATRITFFESDVPNSLRDVIQGNGAGRYSRPERYVIRSRPDLRLKTFFEP